jgi:hypothetical protein
VARDLIGAPSVVGEVAGLAVLERTCVNSHVVASGKWEDMGVQKQGDFGK